MKVDGNVVPDLGSLDRTYEELKRSYGITVEFGSDSSLDRTYEELKQAYSLGANQVVQVWIVPMRN